MAETLNQATRRWGDKSRISGAAKLRRFLRRLPGEIRQPVQDAVQDGAATIYHTAFPNIPAPGEHPYATGELKRKVRVRVSRDGLSARVGSWGKRRARHIHLVEFGVAPHDITMPEGGVVHHPGAPAMPFLQPAFKMNRDVILRRIRTAVREALARAAREGGR